MPEKPNQAADKALEVQSNLGLGPVRLWWAFQKCFARNTKALSIESSHYGAKFLAETEAQKTSGESQGLYAFVAYFILHNQLCCPVKASYSIEMDGHRSPGSAFFTPGSGMPSAGAEISKSTQNLISAMEEIPVDWERPGSQAFKQSPQNGTAFTTSGGYSNGSLVNDEELQEFDDLIFVLKAGSGLNISDTESCHGSQDGGSMANSQIVELRRIPIADTHL
ncbi:hypothetical protein FKM82_000428 [Ascaphus truei]